LAQHYVDDHLFVLNLDVDRLRSLIGGWRADPTPAGLLARAIALAAARGLTSQLARTWSSRNTSAVLT
jgi:hypothetical protein